MEIKLNSKYIELYTSQNKWTIDTNEYHIVLKDEKRINLSLIDEELYEDDYNVNLYQRYRYLDSELLVSINGDKKEESFKILISPIKESENYRVESINIPGILYREDTKYIIPWQQGIIFDSYEKRIDLPFGGSFASSDAYLNMIGIKAHNNHSLIIVEDYFDAYYQLEDYLNQTQVAIYFKASLNQIRYTRKLTLLSLNENSEIIDYAKAYRQYIEKDMTILTLKEKVKRYPFIENLIGSCVLHTGIHTIMQEDSYFYDKCDHEFIRPIGDIKKALEDIYEKGIKRVHLHLDGAGYAYDNEHPNFGKISDKTGGYEALNDIKDYLHKHNSLITIHDNYRDLYVRSSVYDKYYSIKNDQQEIASFMSHWAGGRQEILCASKAMNFFLNNTKELHKQFVPDGVYTDVFTCNPMDECFDYHHQMTRTECAKYRKNIMQEVLNRNMISSSEEVNIFAINNQITAHYAPNPMMMRNTKWMFGINIPFFSMVFHDCLVIPWMMDMRNGIDLSLFALLNGGIPYIKRDGAYPNTDGSFGEDIIDDRRIKQCKIAAKLHEKVAYDKIVDFKMSDDGLIQSTSFSGGINVTININDNTYMIKDSL